MAKIPNAGRPRIFHVPNDGGTIYLKNMTKDEQEVILHLLKYRYYDKHNIKEMLEYQRAEINEKLKNEVPAIVQAPKLEVTGDLPNSALGVRQNNSGVFEVIVVKYNADSKEALVVEIIPASDNRIVAQGKFKMKAVDLGIV